MKRTLSLVLLLACAAGIGLWLGARVRAPTAADLERSALRLDYARALLPYRLAFRVALGAVLLLTLGGLGWGSVRWLHRRVDTVYPDDAGLYPVREGRIGRARVFHDPNRAPTGTTVYAAGQRALGLERGVGRGQPVYVEHALLEGGTYLQELVTGQAQAAQAIRAAVSGGGPPSGGPGYVRNAFAAPRVSRPLPEVVTLDLEPSHVERLLVAPEGGDGTT